MRHPIGLIIVALVLAGCGLFEGAANDSECPETIAEGGVVDGIDLAAPEWLPAGLPLPEGMSIRHINETTDSGLRILTGFVADADPAAIATALGADFAGAGYEMLLVAEGFVSVSGNVAFVALIDDVIVLVDVTHEELPVRVDGNECPPTEGTLVGMRFDQAPAAEARALYAESSLTLGTATAAIGDQVYMAEGECFIHDQAYVFGAPGPTGIGLHFSAGLGYASVDVADVAAFGLDVTPVSGVEPEFGVTPGGFFVEGMFIDALGDLPLQPGRVEVTCG